jgi:methyl-accepting chemotaxis protein
LVIFSVNEIAEQSKILAVNASIEAAKAGKYGVGFAMVAKAVKELAEQSKQATLRITETIGGVHRAIQAMSETVSKSGGRVQEGIDAMDNAKAIVKDLREAIIENTNLANAITGGVIQQNVGLEQIFRAIEQISSAAQDNRSISERIRSESDQMNKAIQQLDGLVRQISGPA